MSTRYVNGEMNAIGVKLIGMNMGLIKIRGNLIRMVKTIVFPGVSVEGTERIRLKQANAKHATIIPIMIIMRFIESCVDKNISPKIKGIEEKIIP